VQRINADIIQDKAGLPWWLGLGVKGVAVYDHNDRKTPRKVCELVQCDTRTVQVLLPVLTCPLIGWLHVGVSMALTHLHSYDRLLSAEGLHQDCWCFENKKYSIFHSRIDPNSLKNFVSIPNYVQCTKLHSFVNVFWRCRSFAGNFYNFTRHKNILKVQRYKCSTNL